jgi:hypothetical protein
MHAVAIVTFFVVATSSLSAFAGPAFSERKKPSPEVILT